MFYTIISSVAVVLFAVDLPSTPVARLFRRWLDTFNGGDLDRYTEFISQHRSARMRQGVSPREVAKAEMRFRDRTGGGYNVYEVDYSSDTELHVTLEEQSALGWARAVVRMDPARSDLISWSEISPTSAPCELRPERQEQGDLVKDVHKLLDRLSARDQFSGVLLVARHGKPVLWRACGFADRETNIPNGLNTNFQLGSINKMFTSLGVAQLVQQGRLNFTDRLSRWIPEYPDQDVAAKITVHHLLTHTSGLGDFRGPEFDEKKEHLRDLADYLELFQGQTPRFDPGQAWLYSNAGMILGGMIIERASGQNYFDYVRKHIYQPAGMEDTDTYPKTSRLPNLAVGYTKRASKWESNYGQLPLMASSAGGGISTASDLLRYDQALRGYKLLNAELTKTIITPKTDTAMHGRKYAYGMYVSSVDGRAVIGHIGSDTGANTSFDMYWESGYTVIVLSNLDPPIAEQVNSYIRDRIRQ